ncbi:MAG: acetylesterase [Treponema sp.]|jgi:S-formylglutathione hydrolase FrmB|nr:acetylesterase [Treponema sp.]
MLLRGTINARSLGMETGINVFVPETLDRDGPYRVAYLLHGLRDNQDCWFNKTSLPEFARGRDIIFVTPEAGRSFYTNMRLGLDYFTWVADELPETISRVFHISARTDDTAVIGCSMGGYGALKIAFLRPDRFGFCGAIAPALLYVDELLAGLRKNPPQWLAAESPENKLLYRDFRLIFGENLEPRETDIILKLVKDLCKMVQVAPRKKVPSVYACVGEDDSLLEENRRFAKTMGLMGMPFRFESWPGAHDWRFFQAGLERVLQEWGEYREAETDEQD